MDPRKLIRFRYLPEILFTVLAVPVLFLNLGVWTVQLWDESRVITSSYEMYRDGLALIPTFQGGSDIHRTLPPLLVWLQALCMHLFGPTEFAARFPSALSGVLMGWLLISWSRHSIGNGWIGFLAGMLAICSAGLNGFHALHGADYEGMMIFFMLLQLRTFHGYVESNTSEHRFRWFGGFTLAVALGVLTKGPQALFFFPAFGVYWLLRKGWRQESVILLLSRIGLLILAMSWYYVVRELLEPGYLHWVWMNDLGGRYASAIDAAGYYPQFYWEVLQDQLHGLIYLIPATLLLIFVRKEWRQRGILLMLIAVLLYAVIIQSASTKHEWYLLPIIPLLFYLAVSGCYSLAQFLDKRLRMTRGRIRVITLWILSVIGGWFWLIRADERMQETAIRPEHNDYYSVTQWF
ncbi:MAG: glycosyltransferase family 39 protein, partial [Bacteroidetes bacterium]|nr:glycosyltransferase family 39 protein [Bacteroidota bacterium]